MANLKTLFFTALKPALPKNASLPASPEGQADRINNDLIGLSDIDAMWYYERRKWRGRD